MLAFFRDFFTDGPLGIAVGILLLACIIGLMSLIGYGIYYAVNFWGCPVESAEGVVARKEFIPAHTTFIWAGKVLVPTHYPDNWTITVRVDQLEDAVSIDPDLYGQLEIGQLLHALLSRGRIANDIEIKEVAL